MRMLMQNEALQVNGGSYEVATIIGAGLIGGIIGANYGYKVGESASLNSNAYVQYNTIQCSMMFGAVSGFLGGALLSGSLLIGIEKTIMVLALGLFALAAGSQSR